jgi:hypothetical protein
MTAVFRPFACILPISVVRDQLIQLDVAKGHWLLRASRRHKRKGRGLGPARPAQSPSRGNRSSVRCRLSFAYDIDNFAYRALIGLARICISGQDRSVSRDPTRSAQWPGPRPTRPARRDMDAEAHRATADRAAGDAPPAPPPLRHSPAPENLRLNAGDWAAFVAWCRLTGAAPLPASPATVAIYLASVGEQLSAGALARRAAAIAAQHPPAWIGLARI